MCPYGSVKGVQRGEALLCPPTHQNPHLPKGGLPAKEVQEKLLPGV